MEKIAPNILEIEQKAIEYINKNKKDFIEKFTKGITPQNEKIAILTAGMSGVGKTEFGIFLKEKNPHLLHIDTDEIREFFKPVGYNGNNSDIFQKPASKGFSKLFDYALKHKYSLILDSNLSNLSKALENIKRLLDKEYRVEIFYLYNEPEHCYEYAIKREIVTKRKVPYEVFVKSNINSYKTVIALKSILKNDIILHYIDKREDKTYENINIDFLQEKIGTYFDT
ncbi:zeta toxin family protein [Sulfurimonas sp.]|uniref:zeta toxin family protein n=1 Tax=Sulfurimonas sp. TaxID=2022749 RepID=UPI002615CD16|nr:zeta toxin family protein [Sulfurimonas sp.]